MKKNLLLLIDSIINLVLGILLLLFPLGIPEFFGVPVPVTDFYPTILGGVLFGIGIALYLEYKSGRGEGLGLYGAIVINILGAGTLLIWLLAGDISVTVAGKVILWVIAAAVLGISILEILAKPWKNPS